MLGYPQAPSNVHPTAAVGIHHVELAISEKEDLASVW